MAKSATIASIPKNKTKIEKVEWTPIVQVDLNTVSSEAFNEAIDTLHQNAATLESEGKLDELGFETGIVTMTPQLAEQCLLRNSGNRVVRLGHVKRLAAIMIGGGWKLAQPWLWDGTLVDAQHRAWAVYLSGATIQTTFFVVPKQDQLFAVIDTGKGRTAADALHTAGANGLSPAIAQAVNLVWRYENNLLQAMKQTKIRAMENTEVIAYAKAHPGIVDAAHLVFGSHTQVVKVVNHKGVPVAFAHLVIEEHDEDTLNEFYQPLGNGANLAERSPILALRDRLARAGQDEEKLNPAHRLALLIKAFDMDRRGANVGNKGLFLRDNEKYPRLDKTTAED
jgi:hypothetical protein